MRDIGGKLAAALLGQLAIGDIEGQEGRAALFARRIDAADVKLPEAAAAFAAQFAVALGHGLRDGGVQLAAAVDDEEILPHAACVRAEQALRGRVDAEDIAAVVQQDKPLAEAAGDLGEFVGSALQLAQLRGDLLMLAADAAKEGRKLFIGIVIERMIEVEVIERLDDAARETAGKDGREDKRRDQHGEDRLEHAEQEDADRRAAARDAEHRPVGEARCAVHGFFQEGGGIADALARAGFQRLLHLGTFGVVFQLRGIGVRVVEDGAVGGDPGEAEAAGVDLAKPRFAVGLGQDSGKAQLVLQLRLLHAGKISIEAAPNDDQAGEENRPRDEQDGTEDLFGHVCASHR